MVGGQRTESSSPPNDGEHTIKGKHSESGEATKGEQRIKHHFGKNMTARLEGQWRGNLEGPFLARFGSSGGKAENGNLFKEVGPAGLGLKRNSGLQLTDKPDSPSPIHSATGLNL